MPVQQSSTGHARLGRDRPGREPPPGPVDVQAQQVVEQVVPPRDRREHRPDPPARLVDGLPVAASGCVLGAVPCGLTRLIDLELVRALAARRTPEYSHDRSGDCPRHATSRTGVATWRRRECLRCLGSQRLAVVLDPRPRGLNGLSHAGRMRRRPRAAPASSSRSSREIDPYLEAAAIQRRVYEAGGPALLFPPGQGDRRSRWSATCSARSSGPASSSATRSRPSAAWSS